MPSWVSLNPSECQDFSAINKMGCFAPHFGINLQLIIINNLYDVALQTFKIAQSTVYKFSSYVHLANLLLPREIG